MKRTFKTAGGTLEFCSGTYGPHHDPYSYEEITFIKNNGDGMHFHFGMMTKLTIFKYVEDEFGHGKRQVVNHYETCDSFDESIVRVWFEKFVHVSMECLEKLKNFVPPCRQCGSKYHHSESGYPGETLYLCKNNHIMGGSFNISQVI